MYKLCIGLLFFGLITANTVEAAQLIISAGANKFEVGQEFKVDIYIDTQEEEINALEGELVVPLDLVELKEVRDGNSVVNFWVEQPQLDDNKIKFSGVIPGGYYDSRGYMFSLVLTAKQPGVGMLNFSQTQVLKNDGQGTKAGLQISDFRFQIEQDKQGLKTTEKSFNQPQAGEKENNKQHTTEPAEPQIREETEAKTQVEPVIDKDPPEDFEPQIASSPGLFDGKWFVVFATQDKGVGIDHYEIKEGWGDFVRAQSPYLLTNRNLNTKIQVKAVDRQGNQKIVEMPAKFPKKWYEKIWVWCIIIILVVGGLFNKKDERS